MSCTQVNWIAATRSANQGCWTIYGQCKINIDEIVQIRYNNNDNDVGEVFLGTPVGDFSKAITGEGVDTFRTLLIQKMYRSGDRSGMHIHCLLQGQVHASISSNLTMLCSSGDERGRDTLTLSEIKSRRREAHDNGLTLSYSCVKDFNMTTFIVECNSSGADIQSVKIDENDITKNSMNIMRVYLTNDTIAEEIQSGVIYKDNTSVTVFMTFNENDPVKLIKCETKSRNITMEVDHDSAVPTSGPTTSTNPPVEKTASSQHIKGQKQSTVN